MPSASSILFLLASALSTQARVLPDPCPAACSDVSAYGIEHHRLQDLSQCGKDILYNEIVRINGDELSPEISICSESDAASVGEEKRNADRTKPTEHLIDFHVFSNSTGEALVPWQANHLIDMMANQSAEASEASPWHVSMELSPGNITVEVFAGRDVEATSIHEAISGWRKQFVDGTSTFAAQRCGMGKDKTIGFAADGQGKAKGVVSKYVDLWKQDKCVFDFEEGHVWSNVPVTFKNDVWVAVKDPGY